MWNSAQNRIYILKIPTNKKDKITLKAKEQLFTFSISFY